MSESNFAAGGAAGSMSPLAILNAARKAVPAVNYALGALGVAAAGALITGYLGKDRTAVFILGGMLVAMILLFVFARLVRSKSPSITFAGNVLLWAVTLFFCTFLVFTATAVALGWPSAWASVLGLDQQPKESAIDHLGRKIAYTDVATSRDAIASLVGTATTTSSSKEREVIVNLMKDKLKHQPSKSYDSQARAVRRDLLHGILKIRDRQLRADFLDGRLSDADLVAIDFRNVNALGLNFSKSFLIGSDFRGSNLRSADFSSTYLRNVRFHDADLTGAIFADADWFNTAGLTVAQFEKIEKVNVKQCPAGADGKFSKERFVEFANAAYGVSFERWHETEQSEASKHWAQYARAGDLCDLARQTR